MKRLVVFSIGFLMLFVPVLMFGQGGNQKANQDPTLSRITNLEKGQTGLKNKQGDLKKQLSRQTQFNDSVTARFKSLELLLNQRDDSIKVKMTRADATVSDIQSIRQRMHLWHKIAWSGLILMVIWSLLILFAFYLLRKRLHGVRILADDLKEKFEDRYSSLAEQINGIESKTEKARQEMNEAADKLQREIHMQENRVSEQVNTLKTDVQAQLGSSKAENQKMMQEVLPPLNKKLDDLKNEHKTAMTALQTKVEEMEKKLNKLSKE
ncbi:MAG: hypothetical protein NTU44_08505 [Bacteroidetes bacterium]|nr:hypothetical protein [Bacteroidota bacterium]